MVVVKYFSYVAVCWSPASRKVVVGWWTQNVLPSPFYQGHHSLRTRNGQHVAKTRNTLIGRQIGVRPRTSIWDIAVIDDIDVCPPFNVTTDQSTPLRDRVILRTLGADAGSDCWSGKLLSGPHVPGSLVPQTHVYPVTQRWQWSIWGRTSHKSPSIDIIETRQGSGNSESLA